MSSAFAQAAINRHVQLAATAVISGVLVATVLLGYQSHVHEVRLQHLKQSIGGEEPKDNVRVQDEDNDEITDPEERRALQLARRAQAGDYAEEVILEQLTRNRVFLTPAGLELVRDAVVVVVGCGGVGSHCTAALARSGVSRLRLIDFDQVSLSSLNRHAVATLADVGRPKVRVLARRLQAVAPWVQFDLRGEKFDAASADRLLEGWEEAAGAGRGSADGPERRRSVGFVVDAIDNIDTKVALLAYCHQHGLPVISSMGAATKSDPTKVVVGDISTSAEDGLSRATRRRLKLQFGITGGVPTVYSTEPPGGEGKAVLQPLAEEQFAKGKEAVRELGALPDFRVRILPVLGTMPAVFGYTAANHILLSLSGYPHEYSAIKGRDKMYDQILAAVHGFEERLIRSREEKETQKDKRKGPETGAETETARAGETPVVVEAASAATETAAETPDAAGTNSKKKGGKNAKKNKNKNSAKEAVTSVAPATAPAAPTTATKKNGAPVNGALSAAVGIRLPFTAGDVAFLIEDVYRGRSAVSGLPTRITLVRWQLPADDDGSALSTVVHIKTGEEASAEIKPEQKSIRLGLADLVCMTREEAARHQKAVLLGGQAVAELYDAETLTRIEARRQDAESYEQYR